MENKIQIRKRKGIIVDFDKDKIIRAIEMAMNETENGIDHGKASLIAQEIEEMLLLKKAQTNPYGEVAIGEVEEIQDWVEALLANKGRFDASKRYILYRNEQARLRKSKTNKFKFLSDKFLSKYKHSPDPFPTPLGAIVDARTYNRWLPDEQRRERHWEKVARMVEFNCSLDPTVTREEAEKIYDNVFHLRQNMSGRVAWIGNTPTSFDHPTALFNCALDVVDNLDSLPQMFYNTMLGTGQGMRILKEDVEQLPKFRQGVSILHSNVKPKSKGNRQEYTTLNHISNDTIEIVIGDSREAWKDALDFYLRILTDISYRDVDMVIFNYDNIRQSGSRLKRFGGISSGYKGMLDMFNRLNRITQKKKSGKIKLTTLDLLDMIDSIAWNVVAGNIRRTAIIILMDADDHEVISAKDNLFINNNGNWIVNKDIEHRAMSNNTIVHKKKPSREAFHEHFVKMRYSGEPGHLNLEAALKRNPNAKGLNPCGEIILDKKQFCNLTNLNMLAFVNEDGSYDREGMLEAQRLSSRIAFRTTMVDIEHAQWDSTQKRDRLLGVSLSGIMDFRNATGISDDEFRKLLNDLRFVADQAGKEYAKRLGLNEPLLSTSIKPSGTSSALYGESPGAHYSHAPYYIRRVRMKHDDAVLQVCRELGYNISPEVGQEEETATTFVVDIPMKAPEGKTKYDVSAIDQIKNYLMLQKEYVQHNTSLTVHVRDDEWDEVEQFVYDNWDDIIALSFVSLDDSFYQLMPYEKITKEEYERLAKNLKPFNHSLIKKYEKGDLGDLDDLEDDQCDSGVCAIR